MPICYNCDKAFDEGVEICPFCGSKHNITKENFIKYIGSNDSLLGYQKSYKLILLKYIIETLDDNNQANVSIVIEKVRNFYLNRANNGLPTDIDVDDRIKNIKDSSDYDVFAVMKSQPYKVINDKGFLFLNRNSAGELVFVFNEDITNSFSSKEWKKLSLLIDDKIKLYYETKLPIKQTPLNNIESDNDNFDYNLNAGVETINNFDNKVINQLRRKGIFTVSDLLAFDETNGSNTIGLLGSYTFCQISKFLVELNMAKYQDIGMCYIRHVYCDSCWNGFNSYCCNNNLIYIKDLYSFDFDTLLSSNGFGKNKVDRIKKHYITSLGYEKLYELKNDDNSFHVDRLSIHESNKNLDLSVLVLLGFKSKSISQLVDNGIERVGKLDGISKYDLIKIIGQYKIDENYNILKMFSSDLIQIASDLLLELKKEKNTDIYIMRAEGFTLQDIAESNCCTRERIRQIESKIDRKISPIISVLIENYFEEHNTNHIYVNDVLEFFDDDDLDKIIIYNMKKSDEFEYLSFADMFLRKSYPSQNTKKALFDLASDFIGEGINIFEELDNLNELLDKSEFDYLDADSFLDFLEECGAHFYGDFVTMGKKSYSFLCYKIVEKHFPNGISLYDDEDISKLRELVFQNYGNIDLPDNNRALATALSKRLVISGRGVYKSIKNIQFEYDTIETVKQFIDDSPLNTLYYREIFNEFAGLLAITTNIDNYNCLHGVLQYCYPGEYLYSRDTISKKEGNGIKLSLEDRINNLLVSVGVALHKKNIMEKSGGCSDVMLFNVAINGRKIIQWDYNYYNTMDNIKISEDEIACLKEILQRLLVENHGYCSDGLYYKSVKTALPSFINNNRIANKTNLFYITSRLFEKEYNFSRPHICSLDYSGLTNMKEIALTLLGNNPIIFHSDFSELATKMLWSEITASATFYEIERDTIRISNDEYLKKEFFNIRNEDIDAIDQVLNGLCNELGIISTIVLDDFSEFPDIGYDWNSFLLVSIIEKYDLSFKIIAPKIKDRRYQKSLIVKRAMPYACFEEIVVDFLRSSGIFEIKENDLLSFLIINGLARKIIPKELYESNLIKYNDGTFNIV